MVLRKDKSLARYFQVKYLNILFMKKINLKPTLALALAAFSCLTNIQAQHQKWELGLFLGASQGQTDVQNLDTKEQNLAFGGLVRYHINDNIGLRLNVMQGKLTGDDANYTDRATRKFTFTSPVTEGSLVGEWDILGRRRYRKMAAGGAFKKTISPYVFGGGGYALTNPKTDYSKAGKSAAELANIAKDEAEGVTKGQVVFPLGAGLKIDLSQKVALNLEAGTRLLLNDNLEGISAAGNPDKKDTYSFIGASLSYRFNSVKDADGDGISDEKDACPDVKGTAEMMGCPDTDGDGVSDKLDACPTIAGPKSLVGCPDTDGDGISDIKDACPDVKGIASLKGCPDSDGDGITDKDDACPEAKGLPTMKGCPDTDGDGIADNVDACPKEKGTIENKGCPAILDRDKDGIADKDDACPDIPGIAKFNGCIDSDGDGIEDPKDKCPKVAGIAKNQGCPEIKAEDKKILDAAIYGVVFDSGKSTFKPESYAILNNIVTVMGRYPEYSMSISGHTDNAGDAKVNQKLSEARSKACYDYLVSKGIAANRMSHTGFGETKPKGDNATAAGKAKNRRVEFELSVK